MFLKGKLLNCILLVFTIFFTGCIFPNTTEELAIDKLYIPKQCPIYEHEFVFNAKKYNISDKYNDVVLMTLEDMVYSLESYKLAKKTFNTFIDSSNKSYIKKSPIISTNRVEQTIYLNRVCPTFEYEQEFNAFKLVDNNGLNDMQYIVIPLTEMIYQMETSKLFRTKFNDKIKELNKK